MLICVLTKPHPMSSLVQGYLSISFFAMSSQSARVGFLLLENRIFPRVCVIASWAPDVKDLVLNHSSTSGRQ